MASTPHDFGRPISQVKKLNNEMSLLFNAFGMKSFGHFYSLGAKDPELKDDNMFDKLSLNLLQKEDCIEKTLNIHYMLVDQVAKALKIEHEKSEQLVASQRKKLAHGYVGALILCRNVLEYSLSFYKNVWEDLKQSNLYKALKLSMVAIFFHDMEEDEVWNELLPQKNFFAFLLCLTDQLQEWDRGIRPSEKWPDCHLSDFDRNDTDKHIRIAYYLFHNDWNPEVKSSTLSDIETKDANIKMLIPSTPFWDIKITLEYRSNCDAVNKQFSYIF